MCVNAITYLTVDGTTAGNISSCRAMAVALFTVALVGTILGASSLAGSEQASQYFSGSYTAALATFSASLALAILIPLGLRYCKASHPAQRSVVDEDDSVPIRRPPTAPRPKDWAAYNRLKEMGHRGTVQVVCEDGTRSEPISLSYENRLGKGGTKSAYDYDENHVILLPNMDANSPGQYTGGRWERMIDHEVATAQKLSQSGLLTPIIGKVWVEVPSPNPSGALFKIPALLSRKFTSFSKYKIYIWDTKNPYSSTLKESPMFSSENARLEAQNWLPHLDLLLKDIAHLYLLSIPIKRDTKNLAMQKESNGPCKIRFFGFDCVTKKGMNHGHPIDREEVKNMLVQLIEEVFFMEYANASEHGWCMFLPENTQAVRAQLVEQYTQIVLQKIGEIEAGQR